MAKKKVGIIFGGKSSEHEVSLQSAKNIVEAIDRDKYDIVLLGIDKNGKWHILDESSYLLHADDPKRIQLNTSSEAVAIFPGEEGEQFISAASGKKLEELDVAFPIVHGTLGEDGSLQGMLRMANIPFVGSNVLSSSLCMDKDIAKRLMEAAGIQVAKSLTFTRVNKNQANFEQAKQKLGTPMFVKPANQGSSVGVSKVETKEEFDEAITLAFDFDHKVIVEEAIVGREIECSVLGLEKPKASKLGEILPQTEFYSYESKYIDEEGADLAIPADVTNEETEKIQEVAVKTFETLECEGLARVDVFLTTEGEVYVNEVNTLPGFTQISMYPKLWEISGISYSNLISYLLEYALERHERDQQLKSSVFDS